MLDQKPVKGTLLTDHGIEQLDYTISPCTTHPEFFLRIRHVLSMIINWRYGLGMLSLCAHTHTHAHI